MRKSKLFGLALVLINSFSLASCSSEPTVGPQGEQGIQGEPGKDGEDGHTPEITIGENGNWFIDGEDTGVSAQGSQGEPGKDGEDGHTPEITIGENGNWFIDGEDTGVSAQGSQGEPGKDGEDGHTPEITIGENGNWYIDGVDTEKPATVTESYMVSFDAQGGTLPVGTPTIVQVLKGMTIENLPTPTRNDFEFLGWFTGFDTNSGQFTTTTPVNSDLRLVARWRSLVEDTYTITWVNYDGSVLEEDKNVLYGDVPIYDGETPTKPSDAKNSYSFSGWSPEVSETYSNRTYVAQYESVPVEHVVRFNLGDYGSIAEKIVTVEGGDAVYEPSIDYTNVPENMVLTRWYLDEAFKQPVDFPYVPETDVTLYGKWEEVTDVSNYLTYYYDSDRNGYVVRSYNEVYPLKTIRIPDTWDDGINGEHSIVGLKSAFYGNKNINKVILPETLEFIGDYAFNYSSLTDIDLPESLEEIGDYAFCECPIESIEFPSSLTSLGSHAFAGSSLTNVDMSKTSIASISDSAFRACTFLTTILFPSNLNSIGVQAFTNCYNLTSISFPDSLEIIGNDSFSYCDLKSIILPPNLQSIGGIAFHDNKHLSYVIIPATVVTMGGGVFLDCDSLTAIYCLNLSMPDGWDKDFNSGVPVYYYSPTDPGSAPGNFWHYNEEGQPWKW